MPKVSVIIPVYGVEQYIERCARSLFAQTLDDIEYLFVDDCTPDNSIVILQQVLNEYPWRKEQVVIHRMEKNRGQAAVRTWGIKHSTGDFITHCDSDDWVELDAYRLMYEKAIEEDADVVVCDFARTDGTKINRIEKGCSSTIKDIFIKMLFLSDSWSLCNKLFRRTVCFKEDFVFPKGNMGEDMVICFQQVMNANKVLYLNKPFYNYYHNPTSITRAIDINKIYRNVLQLIENIKIVLNLFKEHKLANKYQGELTFLKYHAKLNAEPLCIEPAYHKFWCNIFPEINRKVLFMDISFKGKIHYYICLMGFAPIIYKNKGDHNR